MRRLGLIVALMIVASAIEITVVIVVGHVIGWAWTLLLLLGTSALGAGLLRSQGGRAWRTLRADASAGHPPGNAVTDGVLVLAGGVFMLVPGFVSDVVGLFLLLPPTRHLVRGVVQRLLTQRISPSAANSLFGPRRVRVRVGDTRAPTDGQPGQAVRHPAAGAGDPLEGEIVDR